MIKYAVLAKMPNVDQLQVIAVAAETPQDALTGAANWCIEQNAPEAQMIGVLSQDEVTAIAQLLAG